MGNKVIPTPRVLIPNGCRRKDWHDYSGHGVYLITLYRHPSATPLSTPDDSDLRFPLTETGEIIRSVLSRLDSQNKGIVIQDITLLPDYVSFLLYNRSTDNVNLTAIVSRIKELINERYLEERYSGLNQVCEPENLYPLIAGGFDDRIARRKSDVERFKEYIGNLTSEYQTLSQLTTFYIRTVITRYTGRRFAAIGNPLLLDDPQKLAVRISSKFSEEELMKRKTDWFRTILNGGVIVSPFVSGKEYKVMKWALENGGRVIRLLPNGFREDYQPDEETLGYVRSGRLLLIAPEEHNPGLGRPPRELCLAMNALAEEICT